MQIVVLIPNVTCLSIYLFLWVYVACFLPIITLNATFYKMYKICLKIFTKFCVHFKNYLLEINLKKIIRRFGWGGCGGEGGGGGGEGGGGGGGGGGGVGK